MPLFKYGAGSVGEILIDGSVQFPLIQVSGSLVITINGDVYLPLVTVHGLFAADGNISIPTIRISGRMQNEASGDIVLPLLGVSSEILGSSAINGGAVLHGLFVNGDMQAECSISLPQIRVLGLLQSYGFADGAVNIPLIRVRGEIEQVQYLAGNVVLPTIALSGAVGPSLARTIEGAIYLPGLRVIGAVLSSDYSFSEDDAVLRYVDSRRLI